MQSSSSNTTSVPGSTPAASSESNGAAAWVPELEQLAADALPDFLLRQRWYPAKDAGRPQVSASVVVPVAVPGMAAAAVVWQVQPPGRPSLNMFVALAVVPEDAADAAQVIAGLPAAADGGKPQVLVEGFAADDFVRAWVAMLLEDQGEEPLRSGRSSAIAGAGLGADGGWQIRRSSAEQSNTSIRIGDKAIMKVIRKLEKGIHPELEVGRFLTGEAGFEATPAMLAWAEVAGAPGGATYTLCVMQSFVPNQGDGWEWVVKKLAHAAGDGDAPLAQATAWLSRLGERTAQMHRAFGIETSDPAFKPEPATREDLQGWVAAGHALERRAFDGLEAAGDQLGEAARECLRALQARRGALSALLDDLAKAKGATFSKTRHHGDYHLGQVLVAGDDAMIVDFEGEPMRPLEERRAKHAALRDVAGLLRSLSYAAAAAGRGLPQDLAQDLAQADREAALQRLGQWERSATQAFLAAYLPAAQGAPGCPDDPAEAERIVRFFMLEKALYEVTYELSNRPDWVEIPMRGILQLMDEAAAPLTRRHEMPFGAQLSVDGAVRFRLWAPSHPRILLELDGAPEEPLQSLEGGWHELVSTRARAGSLYRFVLPDGLRVPDPASRYQPQDVHGPSEVVDPTGYLWRDAGWKGRAWEEAVVYELHVGAFTQEGTFRAIIERLDHLVSLGVTALEIMPVADFPGRRNWGYDGVLPYAPDSAYGRPEDFKALVDAAHARGLMVLLDVVYNHFGPEGAYLHAIAPETFTDRHKTPWGAAINTDGAKSAAVREYFIHNALYWIEEFHLDGLRLDAVHAILDDGPQHLLAELAERVRAAAPGREIHLVLENEENQASRLERDDQSRPRWYTAQWNDDVHHVLHVAASGEAHGYYGDYHGDTGKLGRALAEGFAFQGEVMPYRGHERGEPSAALPPPAFIAFMQNHDQVGNRAFGERLTAIAPPEAVRAMAAVYLLLPQIPMLFMGEEWAASQPFPFFCDFGPELADAVRNGRREEFARFPEFQDPQQRERIPDPVAEETFASAKLGWEDLGNEPHAGWLSWYRRALGVRHAEIVPLLRRLRRGGRHQVIGDGAVLVRWLLDEGGGELVLAANLSAAPVAGFPPAGGRVLWEEGAAQAGEFAPWTVRWTLQDSSGETDPRSATGTETAAQSPLDRLALQMGIEPSFKDAHGRTVQTGDQTKRRLLAAMGVQAADDAQAQAALDVLEREQWLNPLPPVLVIEAAAEDPAVELVQPAGTGEIEWRLELEDGSKRDGRVDCEKLSLLAEITLDGRRLQRRRLPLPGDLPLGYHRLCTGADQQPMTLVVSPGSCWLPDAVAGGSRMWGIAAQLYLLRSASDWGIGDFGDLRTLVELAAGRGADVIGLNPLHAMFPDNPAHASPYSPASRLLLNVLNIDVTAVPELADGGAAAEIVATDSFQHELDECRAQRQVDYVQVAALKMPVLQELFESCRDGHDQARWHAFQAFRREQGEVLERNCLYLALREHFADADPARADWHDWPQAYRDPASPAVARFAGEHRQRLDFLVWLQWVADEQLGAAAAAAAEAGMAIGLYRDLAVGSDRAGAETWANASAVVSDAQVGAPPDIFNPAGQDWGLPPFQPRALRREAYRSFIELIRANMRHAGGLRIDHVMGLQHLYWVPAGEGPSSGAYVQYPLEDMVGILALESHRQRCLVVGEDLGTVPEGFRERMAAANILSYRVLFFEQDKDGAYLPPSSYPELALAVVGSHDLPTLRGWWQGRDLEIKRALGLFPDEKEAASQQAARERDRDVLLRVLRQAKLLPMKGTPDIEKLSEAAHAFLARTPSVLAMAQLDDLTDEADPVNVPATSDEHPNWRRRHSLTLEELATQPAFDTISRIFREARGAAAGS